MDDDRIEVDSTLQFECPRCGHLNRDEYEVIQATAATDWRCGGCRKLFSVLLCECDHCAAETVTVAHVRAEQAAPAAVTCQHCGRPCQCDEELEGSDRFA